MPELPAEAGVALRVARRAARLPGAAAGAAARRQAGAGRDRGAQRRRGVHPAQAAPGRGPHRALGRAAGDPGRARARHARRCASSASTSSTCRAPTWSPRSWCSRTGWPASPSTAGSRSADGAEGGRRRLHRRGGAAAVPPLPRRDRREAGAEPAQTAERRGRAEAGANVGYDAPGSTSPVTCPRSPCTDRASTPRPGARASSPTRRTCWSSTVASPRWRRPPTCSPSSASPTSRCAGWPSGWRRCGCPPNPTR